MSEIRTTIGGSGTLFGVDVEVDADITKTQGETGLDWRVRILPDATINLSQSLEALAEQLSLSVTLPDSLQLSATIEAMVGEVTKPAKGPSGFDVAARFKLEVLKHHFWQLDLSYTSGASINGKPAMVNGKPAYVFGMSMAGPIELSQLPLIGSVPEIGDLIIEKIGFFYSNAEFRSADDKLDFTLPNFGTDTTLAPAGTKVTLDHGGFNLAAMYQHKGHDAQTMAVPMATSTKPAGEVAKFSTTPSVAQSPIKWINIGKTFGPVGLQKIGLGFSSASDPDTQSGSVGIYVDGMFQVAGLGLEQLGFRFDMPKSTNGKVSFDPLKDIHFHLGGLLVDYRTPSFQISGGFVTLPGGSVNFVGEFILNVGEFGIQAYGGKRNS